MGKPESNVENYFKKKAKENGWMCLKFASPGTNGVPDRIILKDGSVKFVELKAPNEVPRPLQIATFKQMEKHGCKVFVIDTKPKVDKFFSDI